MGYFPNASCPGAARFQAECVTCPHGESPCPILLVHDIYNYTQCDDENFQEALALLVTHDGECQMRKLIVKGETDG